MSSLTQQLDEFEKQIKTAKEQEQLKQIEELSNLKKLNNDSNEYIKVYKHRTRYLDVNDRSKYNAILSTQPKFESLYEIIKKQDDRIKKLETLIEKIL